MRVILRIIAGLVLILALLVIASFFLPREVTVSRSIQIDAPAAAVFPYLNSLQKSAEWSPWLERDPNVQLTYSGPEAGVGNTLEWQSDNPNVGSGRQEITLSKPNDRVETALDFGPMGTAMAYFALLGEGNTTDVTWGFASDMGNNPMGRWMGLMMDKWVGDDYEKGLANLKALVEAN
ncbi:MAG: SRPBCC family protein [Marinibacterium sp.]